MGKCVVKECDSRSQNHNKITGITFHTVPKDAARRDKWVEIIRLLRKETDWLPTKSTVICSKHFRDQDKIDPKSECGRVYLSNEAIPMLILEHDMENYIQYKIMGSVKRIRLKPDCIPTRFDWNRKQTPAAVKVKSRAAPNDAEQQSPRTGRPRAEPLTRAAPAPVLRSPVRPRGSALPCEPIKVTSGPSPVLQKCQANIKLGSDFNPVITRVKSEADPIKREEDPQSDDTLSLAEDTDQLSDPDQPSEDLIPLSTAQVPLSNALDPLSDVKVEESEVGVDEVEEPNVPLPLHLRQELILAGNDCYNLIRFQANQINKLSVRCGTQRRKLRSYVQVVRRRNRKIGDLQAELAALRSFIRERGLETKSIGRGKLDAPTIQIQSSNTAVVEKKHNRQLLIVKRDHNRPKSLVGAQPTSDILQKSSVGVKRTLNIQEKSSVAVQGTSGIRQTSTGGVKRMLNIRAKSSVAQSTSSIPKTSLTGLQRTSNVKRPSVGVKRTSVNLKKSSSSIPDTSNILQKQKSPGIRQKSSADVKRIADILNKPSVPVQPISVIPQTSPVGFHRTSDIGQNALVIQIDGMHSTVLQPKLVRLEDNSMETG